MPPIRLGAFLIDRPLGAGGMAAVWAGRHADSDLPVAVKLIADLSDRLRERGRGNFHS